MSLCKVLKLSQSFTNKKTSDIDSAPIRKLLNSFLATGRKKKIYFLSSRYLEGLILDSIISTKPQFSMGVAYLEMEMRVKPTTRKIIHTKPDTF